MLQPFVNLFTNLHLLYTANEKGVFYLSPIFVYHLFTTFILRKVSNDRKRLMQEIFMDKADKIENDRHDKYTVE